MTISGDGSPVNTGSAEDASRSWSRGKVRFLRIAETGTRVPRKYLPDNLEIEALQGFGPRLPIRPLEHGIGFAITYDLFLDSVPFECAAEPQ